MFKTLRFAGDGHASHQTVDFDFGDIDQGGGEVVLARWVPYPIHSVTTTTEANLSGSIQDVCHPRSRPTGRTTRGHARRWIRHSIPQRECYVMMITHILVVGEYFPILQSFRGELRHHRDIND